PVRQPLRAALLRISLTIRPRATSIMPSVKNTSTGTMMASSTTANPLRGARFTMGAHSLFTPQGKFPRQRAGQITGARQPGRFGGGQGNHHGDLISRLGRGHIRHRAIDLDRGAGAADAFAGQGAVDGG